MTPTFKVEPNGEGQFDVIDLRDGKVLCTCKSIGELTRVVPALEAAVRLVAVRELEEIQLTI